MTGIVISGLTIGQLIAPPVVSRLIAAHDWRLSYTIVGGVVLILIILAAQFLRRDPGQTEQPPDSENEGRQQDLKSDPEDFTLGEAVQTAQFWLVAVIIFCVGFAGFAIMVHIVPHAIQLGIPAVTASNILAINGGVGILGNFVLGGIIGDRIGNRKAFLIGSVLMAASLFWLVPAREVWMLYLFAIGFGIGLGGAGTSESPLIAGLFGLSSHGLIYGVFGLSFAVGGAVGPVVTGYMCDVIGNYQLAFLVSGAFAVVALLLLAILRPKKRRGIRL